jgi:hypothetical protein
MYHYDMCLCVVLTQTCCRVSCYWYYMSVWFHIDQAIDGLCVNTTFITTYDPSLDSPCLLVVGTWKDRQTMEAAITYHLTITHISILWTGSCINVTSSHGTKRWYDEMNAKSSKQNLSLAAISTVCACMRVCVHARQFWTSEALEPTTTYHSAIGTLGVESRIYNFKVKQF